MSPIAQKGVAPHLRHDSPGRDYSRNQPVTNRTSATIPSRTAHTSGIHGKTAPAAPTPLLPDLTDASIEDAVCRNHRVQAVWLNGWERGYLAGLAAMQLSNEQLADLAARRFIALTALDVDIRRQMKSTREFVDVLAARKRAAA